MLNVLLPGFTSNSMPEVVIFVYFSGTSCFAGVESRTPGGGLGVSRALTETRYLPEFNPGVLAVFNEERPSH